jgi:hypothetical protein
VRSKDVIANKSADLREELPKPGHPRDVGGSDPVDPDVVVIEVVMAGRRTHQP